MRICGTCQYLDILESTRPSAKVQDVVDELRADHTCDVQPDEPRAHPNTMIGRR